MLHLRELRLRRDAAAGEVPGSQRPAARGGAGEVPDLLQRPASHGERVRLKWQSHLSLRGLSIGEMRPFSASGKDLKGAPW